MHLADLALITRSIFLSLSLSLSFSAVNVSQSVLLRIATKADVTDGMKVKRRPLKELHYMYVGGAVEANLSLDVHPHLSGSIITLASDTTKASGSKIICMLNKLINCDYDYD